MSTAVPRLSIVIPTKDRYETLVPVLQALTSQIASDEIEFVVQDNSVRVDTGALHALRHDARIKYHHHPEPISIVDNTIRAIEHSKGTYALFIGDDDFITPHVMSFVDLLERSGLSCLIFEPARYWWNTVTFARPTHYNKPSAFWLPRAIGGHARRLKSRDRLEALLLQGGLTYIDMPRFYHGIVRRDALEAIRSRTGTYLPGSSPDMAFSVALALVIDEYAYVDYPVTVFGASRNSGGGWTAQRRHHGRIEDQTHLPKDIMSRWDPMVPRIWSEQTIYPQTIHEVLTRFGSDRHVAYEVFYASLLVNETHLMPYVWPCIRRYYAQHPLRLAVLFALMVKKLGGRLYRYVRSHSAQLMPYDLHEFASVSDAMVFLRDKVPAPARCIRWP
jgi:hypothetical protein